MKTYVILYRALKAGPMFTTLLTTDADEAKTKAIVDKIISQEDQRMPSMPPVCAAWVGATLPAEWAGVAA